MNDQFILIFQVIATYIFILLMSEQQEEKYLETVIGCITERNGTRQQIQEDSTLNNLYGKADTMFSDLDKGISLCKKYNQAKINRKYEIIISDLQTEIKRLQDNLKLQQDARSPTKRHVSDILEKLVFFKNENQRLTKENKQLQEKIMHLELQVENQGGALIMMQNQQAKSTIERLPPINTSSSLAETVREYLKDKQQVRKITKNPVSGLERLLNQLKPKLWNWNIGNLLEEIDKWNEGVKERSSSEVDMWRIRSSIARKFSECMDNPQNLVRPSPIKSGQSLWAKLQKKNQVKFSYIGSKRSLNSSIH